MRLRAPFGPECLAQGPQPRREPGSSLARSLQPRSSMSEYHEPVEELDDRVRDMHRALVSLKEEIEAADWYAQRMARCADPELKRILEHNLREEVEHAAMLLEWVRRASPDWDGRLRQVLFTKVPLGIAAEHAAPEGRPASPASADGAGLGVGPMKGGTP
jgi:ferritin-like protein